MFKTILAVSMMISNITFTRIHVQADEENHDNIPAAEKQTDETEDVQPGKNSESSEAYAVLSDEGAMTFFRSINSYTQKSSGTFTDIAGNEYTGVIFTGIETLDAGSGGYTESLPWYESRRQIKSIRVADGQVISPVSMAYWFNEFSSLTVVDLNGFDTSAVKDMQLLFTYCGKLEELDLSMLDTSGVENMRMMFSDCRSLKSLNLRGFNTSKVKNMGFMFSVCESLESLDVSSFDTSSVTNMQNMFNQCDSLTELDLHNFDTSLVTNMDYMFACARLIDLDISGFDLINVSTMIGFFFMAYNVTRIQIGEKFVNWQNYAVLPEGTWRNPALGISLSEKELYEQFPANASQWAGEWVRDTHAYAVLDQDGNLTFFRSANNYENGSSGELLDCYGNTYTGTVYTGFEYVDDAGKNIVPWSSQAKLIKSVRTADGHVLKPDSMSCWFMGCSNLTDINLDGIDTSKTIAMDSLFSECHSLASLDLNGLKTGNVTNMVGMFYECRSLTVLDVHVLDTSQVENMFVMFSGCSGLRSLDLSSFDTSSVTDMADMFYGCSSLTELDLGSFDTSNVTDMVGLFGQCRSLTHIDLSSFNTAKVNSMVQMFSECAGLEHLDLSHFDTAHVTNMSEMFADCTKLKSLDISSFNTSNVIEMASMFNNCSSLQTIKLGEGFVNWIDHAYLREGGWTNREVGVSLTMDQLYEQYPSHAAEWKGAWHHYYPVTSVSLDETSITLDKGSTRRLYAKIEPDNATIKDVIWSSSNESIVSVSQSGIVTGVDFGNAEITVTSSDGGHTATCFVTVAENNHDYETPVYIWSDDLSSVSASTVCSRCGNTLKETVKTTYAITVKPTCEEPGSGVYTAVFASPQFTIQTRSVELPAFGHQYINDHVTWDEEYKTAAFHFVCEHNPDHSKTLTVDTVTEEYTPPTCTVNGRKTIHAEAIQDGKTYTAGMTLILPAAGHEYMDPVYKWAEDNDTVTASATCRHCGDEVKETVSTELNVIEEPKCETDGTGRYIASFENDLFEDQFKTVILPAKGHHYELKEWIWSDDNHTCSAVFVCTEGDDYQEIDAAITRDGDKLTASVEFGGKIYSYTKADKYVEVQDIELDRTELKLRINETQQLRAQVMPSDADDKSIRWSSLNPEIADVDQYGKVTAKSAGMTQITASSVNGLSKTCQVTVLFNDVPAEDKYYSAAVYWAVENGITNGYRDPDNIVRTFKPQNKCTREAVVTFLWRLAGKPEPESLISEFKDVRDRSKYYYKAVLWASEKGITKGYADGTFRPDAVCLREHVVTFLYRYAGKPAPVSENNPFNDVKRSDYYYKAVLWANENGITKGYSSGIYKGGFGPKAECLREHVVTFLYRYAN